VRSITDHFASVRQIPAQIAGEVPNWAHDLVRWISSPQSIEPGTAMPDLGVHAAEARDIAAYLYTLR
jgi:cytochrome c